MAKMWKWSFWDAVSIMLKTYIEDWGAADKVRRALLSDSDIAEIRGEKNITGLTAGAGQPVIFIHGTPGNALRWKNYFNNIPKGRQIISIDRMGFGKRHDQSPDLEKDCEQLSTFIQKFSAPIIVGHSLGGALALRIAATLPVKGLVLVAACIDPKLEHVLPVQKIGALWPITWVLSNSIHHSNLEMFQLHKFMQSTEQHLKKVLTPIHIVHAKDDGLVPVGHIDYARANFTKAAFIRVTSPETGGHGIAWSKPDLVLNAIKSVSLGKEMAA